MKDETIGLPVDVQSLARIKLADNRAVTVKPPDSWPDPRPRVFIRSDVMREGNASIRWALAHEMIHAAGKPGQGPDGFFAKLSAAIFGHNDLSYMGDSLDRIMEACGHNR